MTTEAMIHKENQEIETLKKAAERASSLGAASSIGAIAGGLGSGILPVVGAAAPIALPVIGILAAAYFLSKKLGYEKKIEAIKHSWTEEP